jgi:hypothetical protein
MWAESRVWVDGSGGRTITLVRSVAGAAAISAAALAQSNADWAQVWESAVTANTPAPATASYPSVALAAALTFVCADGTLAVLKIPAPVVGLFLADGQTVDPVAAAAVITACVGSLVSSTGSPTTAYVSGVLTAAYRQPL